MPTHAPARANRKFFHAELPRGLVLPVLLPSWHLGLQLRMGPTMACPAPCCAWASSLLPQPPYAPRSLLAVGVELCSPFSSGSSGYGSQPGGEFPFAKLDNRLGSLSEDWRGGSTCCSWRGARSALPGSGKGRPGCSQSWQVAQTRGWTGGPGLVLPIGCLRLPPCLLPWPAAPWPAPPASPAACKLPEQAPPAGPCRAVIGSERPLPWTCLRSSSPCWSTLCRGQTRGQVGAQAARGQLAA